MSRFAAIALLLLAGAPLAAAAKPAPGVPAAAAQVIAQVHAAAAARDLDALRALMDENEFTSSFGGDGGVDEAISLWRADPSLLPKLAKVTDQPCELSEGYVECPAGAESGYRAGFKLTAKGWRMQWFLAGD